MTGLDAPVAFGTAALGAVSGIVGTFAVVRRRSLQGDAVSHAALPGVALAYLLGGRSEILLVLGAAVTGWVAMMLVSGIVRSSRVPFDAALAGALSVFFGFGVVLLLYLKRNISGAATVRPELYIFGQDPALMEFADLIPVLGLGGGAVAVIALFWKEFKILSFDPDFAASLGFSTRWLDVLLTALVVLAVVVGLQTVGVVLMSALIVAPAAGARQWSDRLGSVTLIAGLFGAAAGFLGTAGSAALSVEATVPTGPSIVLMATALALGSILLAPNRGILWKLFRRTTLVPPGMPL